MKPKFATMVPIMVLSILVIGIIIIPATSDSLAIKRDAIATRRTLAGVGGVGVGVVTVPPPVPPTVPPVVMPPSGGGLGGGGLGGGGTSTGGDTSAPPPPPVTIVGAGG